MATADIVIELNFEDLLNRILAGERPFEGWMYTYGHSDEEIAEICRVIDQRLIQQGVVSLWPGVTT